MNYFYMPGGVSRLLLAGLCSLLLAACSPAQGYPGARRTPEETARIYFSAHNGASLSGMRIDQQNLKLFDAGMELLPGRHSAEVRVHLQNELWCYDDDRRHCLSDSYHGRCSVVFNADAGQRYVIRVMGAGGQPAIWVINEDNQYLVSSGDCS